ncbi:MAG TPA: metallophosphoesterase [Actinomycetota bacterium]|nr:metallophosphoesterase [Actinomycetota bacterium]
MTDERVVQVAAVADVHVGRDSAGIMRRHLHDLDEHADVLLLAGDLTTCGDPDEARVLARELDCCTTPKIAVLGNHDHHADRGRDIRAVLERAGVTVLEGDATTVDVRGVRVGVAGTTGFGGGFAGACASDFGEPEMKAFVRHSRRLADSLEAALASLDADVRIALMHYAPVEDTLRGERLEIYPFLGSYLLGEAVDRAGADLALHGHAHAGAEKGVTPGGIHVRNVAQPVIRHAYNVYCLDAGAARRDGVAAPARARA